MMKRSLMLILMLVGVALAQDKTPANKSKPDFSGEWQRNLSKSRYPRGAPPNVPVHLTISQAEPVLKMNYKSVVNGQERVKDLTFYSDNRGEINPAMFQSVISTGVNSQPPSLKEETQKSKTKWQGNKLVTSSSTTDDFAGFRVDVAMIVERKLSADGQMLTIDTIIQTSRGGSTVTEVYDRVH